MYSFICLSILLFYLIIFLPTLTTMYISIKYLFLTKRFIIKSFYLFICLYSFSFSSSPFFRREEKRGKNNKGVILSHAFLLELNLFYLLSTAILSPIYHSSLSIIPLSTFFDIYHYPLYLSTFLIFNHLIF